MKPLDIILRNLFKYSPLLILSAIIVFAFFFVLTLANSYKHQAEINKARYESLIGMREDYKQLTEYTAALETEYATQKDIWKKAQTSWSGEKTILEGRIKALASATFSIQNSPLEQDHPDIFNSTEIVQEVQFVNEDHKLGPAVGVVKIQNETGKTYSRMYDSEIQIDSAITKKDGHITVLTRAWWIQKEASLDGAAGKPDWKDVPYPIKITGGSIVIDPTDKVVLDYTKKFQFAPHLNAGLFVGVSEGGIYGGRIGISGWGYGITKNDLDWKLGELGTNFSNDYIDISIVPIQYRIGNELPLVEDMYLGAGVGVTPTARSFFLNLSTTF